MTIYLLVAFLLSTLCGFIFTPLILDFCKKKRLYDIPNERKVHKNAVPRLGGISFLPSMFLAFTLVIAVLGIRHEQTVTVNMWSISFMLGLTIIYCTGIIDDLIGLNATTKFAAQIVAACLLPAMSLYINNLYGLFGIYEIPVYVGMPLTVFLIVLITNAFNLIDGIDGLASGLALIALGGFLVYFTSYNVYAYTYSVIIAGMMGAVVAFMYFNTFGNVERNTKIFMGDSGSLSLGFFLGVLAIKCTMDNTRVWESRPEALLVAMTLLFLPTIDVARVTLYRLLHHRPIFSADKNHIHHKLMQAGLTQHQTLIAILLLDVLFIAFNFVTYSYLPSTVILIADIALFSAAVAGINLRIKSKA